MSAAFLASCAGTSKEDLGAGIGAIAGALIGSQAGKGHGRVVATLLGAVAGGILGKQFGKYLDEQDQKKIAEATERALVEGNQQVYVAEKSRAKVTMTPTATTYQNGSDVLVVQGVETSYPLVAEKASKVARVDTQARGTPNVSGNATRGIARAEKVDVIATVRDSDWVLVAQNNIGLGYVRAAMLADDVAMTRGSTQKVSTATKPSPVQSQPKQSATTAIKDGPSTAGTKPLKPEQTSVAAVTQPKNPTQTEPVQATKAPASDTRSSQPAVQQVATQTMVEGSNLKKASVAMECKVVTRTIEVPSGPSGKEDVKFCKEPPKDWRMVAWLQLDVTRNAV
jgi:surface antigen